MFDSAPHFVANAALTVAAWRGWSGSFRTRAINHYRLDGDDPSILASGHTIFDLGIASSAPRHRAESKSGQSHESRFLRDAKLSGIPRDAACSSSGTNHATPGYPLTVVRG